MNSPFMTSRPFLSSAAGRAAFGLLVFAVLGGCTSQSAGVKDNRAGGDMQTLIDQRVAAMQADLKAKFDAQVALLNDSSNTKIETSGGNAVVDKRLASVDVKALVDAHVKAALASMGDKHESSADTLSGKAVKESTDQTQQGVLNYQTAGLTGIGLILLANSVGFWAYRIRKCDNENDTAQQKAAEDAQTARTMKTIEGMRCPYRSGSERCDATGATSPQET